MSKLIDFWMLFRLYSKHHTPLYAARIAYGITFKTLPF